MKIPLRIVFLFALFFSTTTYAEVYKCVIDGRTTYSQKECPPAILDPAATKKLNHEAASHGFDGFLDSSGGKRLTCVEAEAFNKSHYTSKTMASCKIDGRQALERARIEGRDMTNPTPWLDGCVEGTCKVGIWRDVERSM